MEGKLSGILIYGAGGHGRVVADVIERQAKNRVAGFIDDNPQLWGREVLGYRVLGGFATLADTGSSCCPIVIAIGDNQIRKELAKRLDACGYSFATAIHPSAQIARDVRIEPGAMVMANVAINPGARIGAHVIVNTGAILDHDCVIHDFVHISPAAALAGNVVVEEGAHIGVGGSVLPNVRIGAYSTVGAGAVVTMNVAPGLIVVGVPAKPKKFEKP